MKRIGYLNTLRLLATLSVVLLHSSATYFDNGIFSENDCFALGFYKVVNVFAVPVFVLISGALFLHPDRNTTYRVLFNKYVRRIVLALVVFGLPMCIVESVFAKENIEVSFVNFVTGHSWAHMWYLYMLIGLYLLTPLLKEFVIHAPKKTMLICFTIMFALTY